MHPLSNNTNFLEPLRFPTHDLQRLTRRVPNWKYPVGMPSVPQGQGPLARDSVTAALEAFLMAADAPLTSRRLAILLKISGDEVKRHIKKLQALYEEEQSAFHIVELAGGYQLRTRESLLPWLLKLKSAPEIHLTPAVRETLTMIAYKQPITRADLEKLRGVACGDILRVLLEKGLTRIVGRDNSLGRPVLYGTTKLFLEMNGLKSLQDLPALKS